MISFLKIISVIAVIYGVYAVISGSVYLTRYGTTHYREQEPITYWIGCLSYILVGGLIFFALTHKYG